MFGRGRGRVVNEESLSVPPRRPGMAPATPVATAPASSGPSPRLPMPGANRTAPLERLFMSNMEDLEVFTLLHNYLNEGASITDIEKLVDFITTRALTNCMNIDHLAKYVWVMSKRKTGGAEILRCFFTQLENYYTNMEKFNIIKGSVKYRNFVNMFMSVMHFTRNPLYPPFDDLINGLFALMEPLVTLNTEDDHKLLALCLVRYAHSVKSDGSVKRNIVGDINSLTNSIRKKIVSRKSDLSETSASWLLFGLEASKVGIDGLSDAVRLHYVAALGHSVYGLASRNDKIRLPKSEAGNYCLDEVQSTYVILV